jgi:hypothetical protein
MPLCDAHEQRLLFPIAAIRVGPRARPVNEYMVRELATSIERHGLLQAIGIKPAEDDNDAFDLVFGAHRLAAMTLLGHDVITALLLPSDLAEEQYQLMELQENSARLELTGAQRKAYAAQIGRLIQKIAENPNGQNLDMAWWDTIWTTMGISEQTLRNWWNNFCAEAGLTLTPKRALESHKQQFFTWLDEQKRLEEAERQRRETAQKQNRQRFVFEQMRGDLAKLAKEYGLAVVKTEVIDEFLKRFG